MSNLEVHRAGASLAMPLALQTELRLPHVGGARLYALVAEGGLPHVLSCTWKTEADDLGSIAGSAVTTGRSDGSRSALLDLGESCWAFVTLRRGTAWACVAAERVADADEGLRWLRERLPEAEATEDGRVPISFWSRTSSGGWSSSRTLSVPAFAEIAENYPQRVRLALDALVDGFRPAAGGQLVLWYGEPGTGKTHVVRALAWEWRDWCDLHYVTDPEELFGSSEYMLDLLLGGDEDDDDDGRWRLLVLEDTGELLSADAKERTGPGLSRFLNVVDGIVGQGLRVLVLVTTNEPLRRLHPAVARPGRCAAQVEFTAFEEEEARAWLARRDVAAPASVPRTLAHLYALAEGRPYAVAERRPVGFAPPC